MVILLREALNVPGKVQTGPSLLVLQLVAELMS